MRRSGRPRCAVDRGAGSSFVAESVASCMLFRHNTIVFVFAGFGTVPSAFRERAMTIRVPAPVTRGTVKLEPYGDMNVRHRSLAACPPEEMCSVAHFAYQFDRSGQTHGGGREHGGLSGDSCRGVPFEVRTPVNGTIEVADRPRRRTPRHRRRIVAVDPLVSLVAFGPAVMGNVVHRSSEPTAVQLISRMLQLSHRCGEGSLNSRELRLEHVRERNLSDRPSARRDSRELVPHDEIPPNSDRLWAWYRIERSSAKVESR